MYSTLTPCTHVEKKIQYKDSANECFNFSAKLVNCKGRNPKQIPVQ